MEPDFTSWRGPGGLVIDEAGDGPPVVLVHGRGLAGAAAWPAQWPLAERWRLVCPYRLGYGASPPAAREDFALDAPLLAALLDEGAHLVAHGYGVLPALLAAAERPLAVWSLTLIEPLAPAAAPAEPAVRAFARAYASALKRLAAEPPPGPEAAWHVWWALLEPRTTAPLSAVPAWLAQAPAPLATWPQRPPAEAALPLDALLAVPCPKWVVSGGHHLAFEAMADSLALALGAQRKALPGAGHVPHHQPAFNPALEQLMLGRSLYRAE